VVLMTLVGGVGTVLGPIAGAVIIVVLQNELADKVGSWVTVIMGAIFVATVLAFRRGVVGEIAAASATSNASGEARLTGWPLSSIVDQAFVPISHPSVPGEGNRECVLAGQQKVSCPRSGHACRGQCPRFVAHRAPAEKIVHIRVIAVSVNEQSEEAKAFRQGLRDAGYTEGRDVLIEWWFGGGHYDRVSEPFADLVQHTPDVIVVESTPAALAAKRATPPSLLSWP